MQLKWIMSRPLRPLLLGGVVTELGGLISHGTMVAREYGLLLVPPVGSIYHSSLIM